MSLVNSDVSHYFIWQNQKQPLGEWGECKRCLLSEKDNSPGCGSSQNVGEV